MVNPRFPRGYPIVNGKYDYDAAPSSRVTLKEQLKYETINRSSHEVVRRKFGLQLFLYEKYDVYLGWGTGHRGSNPEVDQGHSYHQEHPYPSKTAPSYADDTVGYPTHNAAWDKMQLHLNDFGFASFKKGTKQYNWTGRPANVKDDPPHIQPFEVNYSVGNPASPIYLTPWIIPARYDIDAPGFNWDDPLPDTTVPIPPLPNPHPQTKDFNVFKGFWKLAPELDPNGNEYAIYSGGYKIWIPDIATKNNYELFAAWAEVSDEVGVTSDAGWFRALGPIVGPGPTGFDGWGWPL